MGCKQRLMVNFSCLVLMVVTASDVYQGFCSQAWGTLKCDRKRGENVSKNRKRRGKFKRQGLRWTGLKARQSLGVEEVRRQVISDEMQRVNTAAARLHCPFHRQRTSPWHEGAIQVCEEMGLGISIFIL